MQQTPPPQYAPPQYPPPRQFQPPVQPQHYAMPGQFPPPAQPRYAPPGAYRGPQAPPQWPAGYSGPGFPPPGYAPYTQPPKKTNGLLIALIVVIASVFGFIVFAALVVSAVDPTPPSGPSTTRTATPPPNTSGYNPGKLPIPSSTAEAQKWLDDSAVYKQSVSSSSVCKVAAVSPSASDAELQKQLNDYMQCLTDVWSPPLTKAGYSMPKPPVTVYRNKITTACGDSEDHNAAYCGADQQIYFAKNVLDGLPDNAGSAKYAAEGVLAHEFGHAVQARTGLLAAELVLEKAASKSDARLLSRRLEQQADCFEGMYFGSVTRSINLSPAEKQGLEKLTWAVGDDTLSGKPGIDGGHGLGANRKAWFTTGLSNTSIGKCNTWTVPADKVR